MSAGPSSGFHGPKCWILTLLAGVLVGFALARALPPTYASHAEAAGAPSSAQEAPPALARPEIRPWLVAPFSLLLLSIAVMPFVNAKFWHNHFPDFAFFPGGLVAAYYLAAFDRPDGLHAMSYGASTMLHAGIEYYSFMALVGGLFIVSGGIHIRIGARGRPLANTLVLALGAVLANFVGTTGASMLLIRPFMRMNEGRLRPIHIVFFIFIVSNCGGALTPIGDPPLYLGYLKGVPFAWTLTRLWSDWLLVIGLLLAMFAVIDTAIGGRKDQTGERRDPYPAGDRARSKGPPVVQISGRPGLICLALMIAGVFIDPVLKTGAGIEGYPIGATFQIIVAAIAWKLARRDILESNAFTFFPVKEVGILFAGIFATMAPALGYLSAHGAELGISGSTTYFFATGSLSAVLDNAPTYLNFLQISFGSAEINASSLRTFLADHENERILHAISTGAVFFGAMTYIGNGPNFMVKAIAESAGVKMPSFFGYLGLALVTLLPILIVNWYVAFIVLR